MNPELRRNLWLEMSLHRLLAMPAVLALAIGLAVANAERWYLATFVTAALLFVLVCIFWGSRAAAASVSDEVRNRTWDWQRLSSLTPWQMAVGKLWGATSFAWYGGAICLAAMVAALPSMPRDVGGGWVVAGLAFTAVALHAAFLAASLQAARKESRLGQRTGALVALPLLVAVSVFVVPAAQGGTVQLTWYGQPWRPEPFFALSALAFAAWAVVAAHREMARELLVRQLPWGYPLFAAFLALYGAGFGDFAGTGIASAFAIGGFVASIGLTYYALLAETTTAVSLRRFAGHLRARQWRRAAESAPLWATGYATALAFGVAVMGMPHRFEAFEAVRWAGLFPLALLLLCARDLGLLATFALGTRPRRVEGATLTYVIVLSWALPLFLDAVGLEAAARLFWPWELGGTAAAGIYAAHAAIAWGAAWRRWRRASRAYA